MKAIKICKENKAAIESALHAVNGKAISHTYTTFSEIEDEAKWAHETVFGLVGNKKVMVGAKAFSASGGSVPNAYKYSRSGTYIVLEYKSSGWFLTHIASCQLHTQGGKRSISMTQEQNDKALSDYAKKWSVIKPAE